MVGSSFLLLKRFGRKRMGAVSSVCTRPRGGQSGLFLIRKWSEGAL